MFSGQAGEGAGSRADRPAGAENPEAVREHKGETDAEGTFKSLSSSPIFCRVDVKNQKRRKKLINSLNYFLLTLTQSGKMYEDSSVG